MNLKEAMHLLKEKGYKVTKRRKEILSYFYEVDGYRTAKDLIQHLETHYKTISPDTIYRNLYLYDEMGILETTELNGEKQFQMRCTDEHHHHFICNECGMTKHVEVCPMDEVQKLLSTYAIDGHKFEIYGLCPMCQAS